MKEFDLMKSEIKKVERFAANKSNEPCFLAAWSYSGVDDLGWADVLCEMDNTNNGEYVNTVHLCVCIVNETISIVENAGLMGVPIPAAITKAIDILKQKAEEERQEEG